MPTADKIAELICLEEAMWQAATRFDLAFQQVHFAPDFVEFGRSGRVYNREQIMHAGSEPIVATLPLPDLVVRELDTNTVLLTYNSRLWANGVVEHARRSSIWSRTAAGWVMRFHQGTPFYPDGEETPGSPLTAAKTEASAIPAR